MTFQHAIRTCFQKYVEVSGRAARSEFWWWVLFILLGNFAFNVIDGAVFGFGPERTQIFGMIFGLATLLPSICVTGRRLHDRDMSAWWLLLWLVPVAGAVILLVICVLEGTRGPNRFGPDPRGGGAPSAPKIDIAP